MSYEDDSMLKAQKKMLALQKRVLALQKKQTEARPEVIPVTEDISVFEYIDRLENDLNLTRNDLDEYMNYRGTAARNLPSMHEITPLSRKILSVLKKVNFKNVPASDLEELTQVFRNLGIANASLATTVNELNKKGVGGTPRDKDEPFRRLYQIVKEDINSLFTFVRSKLSNVAGHNYLSGLSAPAARPRPPAGPPAGPPPARPPAGPPPAGTPRKGIKIKTPKTPKSGKKVGAGIPKRFL